MKGRGRNGRVCCAGLGVADRLERCHASGEGLMMEDGRKANKWMKGERRKDEVRVKGGATGSRSKWDVECMKMEKRLHARGLAGCCGLGLGTRV